MPDDAPDRPPRETMVDDLAPSPGRRLGRAGRRLLGLALAAATAAAIFGLWRGGDRSPGAPPAPRPDGVAGAAPLPGVYEAGDTVFVPSGEIFAGVVYVDSSPTGLEVRLDGEPVGHTPLLLERRQAGPTAEVELVRDGRVLWRRRVPVVEGGLRVEVDL